jgi:hypothetical protein
MADILPPHLSPGPQLRDPPPRMSSALRGSDLGLLGASTARQYLADDSAIRHEPTQQVDYLKALEFDVGYRMTGKRKTFGRRGKYVAGKCRFRDSESQRLDNACWRAWAKQKYRLGTIASGTLDWFVSACRLRRAADSSTRLKDNDDTWLYGPFLPAKRTPINTPVAQQRRQVSNKSILKPHDRKMSALLRRPKRGRETRLRFSRRIEVAVGGDVQEDELDSDSDCECDDGVMMKLVRPRPRPLGGGGAMRTISRLPPAMLDDSDPE